jgi:EAL domain-containing protein (putative c-di-GMP-specific phosphodiesterase class I)
LTGPDLVGRIEDSTPARRVEVLRRLGVEYAQGYLFGRPVLLEDVAP